MLNSFVRINVSLCVQKGGQVSRVLFFDFGFPTTKRRSFIWAPDCSDASSGRPETFANRTSPLHLAVLPPHFKNGAGPTMPATVWRIRFCLALLPMGFTWPDRSPNPPVSSYLTVSPLPARSHSFFQKRKGRKTRFLHELFDLSVLCKKYKNQNERA